MTEIIDKRARSALFRDRLAQAMEQTGSNQTALARAAGVDRSTISQLLTDSGARLPNAHVVGACAQALGVSTDWLLGLSERPESASDLVAASMAITQASRALVDEQIFAWHHEAAGYKIRHVPAALPDMLKTHDMMRWEYAPHLGKTTEQAINAAADRLDWIQRSPSDYEIALPRHEFEAFMGATGYYEGLPDTVRRAQLAHMAGVMEQIYPRLRVYLFDARKVFSSPVTIFGPLLAVLYIGTNYLIFRDNDRIRHITAHFDGLIRAAETDTRALVTRITNAL